MANGSPKNVGLGEFWQDLEIFKGFLKSLEVSSLHVLFLPLFESRNFLPRSLGLDFLTSQASLGFYHSPPLVMDARGKFGEHERSVRVARGDSREQL